MVSLTSRVEFLHAWTEVCKNLKLRFSRHCLKGSIKSANFALQNYTEAWLNLKKSLAALKTPKVALPL